MQEVPIHQLLYQSAAVCELNAVELCNLYAAAQLKNLRLGISGALLLREGRYFQWLEGSRPSLEALMASIAADSRHNDIEILFSEETSHRKFARWSMLDASGRSAASLFSHTQLGQSVWLAELDRSPRRCFERLAGVFASGRVPPQPPSMLVNSALAPQHCREAGSAAAPMSWLRTYDEIRRINALAETLGNAWRSDRIGSVDMTLGYARLLGRARRLSFDAPCHGLDPNSPRVLVVSPPAQVELLRAHLDRTLFEALGWNVHYAIPETDEGFCRAVSAEDFEGVIVALPSMDEGLLDQPALDAIALPLRQARARTQAPLVLSGRLFDDPTRSSWLQHQLEHRLDVY